MTNDVFDIEFAVLYFPYLFVGFYQAIIVVIILSLQKNFTYYTGGYLVILCVVVIKILLGQLMSYFK